MDEYSILDAELPTMVVRCNNMLVLRSVITGQHIKVLGPASNSSEVFVPEAVHHKSEQIEQEYKRALEALIMIMPYESVTEMSTKKPGALISERSKSPDISAQLPPCKVQRNYCCTHCAYYTQNPRSHLLHQRDVHGVRLSIHSCQYCQYASRYCQKLKRHIKMVHTAGNLQESIMKIEKPNIEACRDTTDPVSKPSKLPHSTRKTSPKVEDPPKPSVELPVCSKAIITPQNSVNAKSDPEAFFVSAYKNQLQMQLEYEQGLKNFLKTFHTEPNNAQEVCETPKKSNQTLTTERIQTNFNINKPHHISEESIEVRTEIDKSRIYSCRKCSYTTHIKSRYNKHVKYHSMPMIQCDKCEFRTTYKWNLTRHLRSHHGNGTYKCSVCTFSANMKQSLTSHEANHHSPPVGRAVGNKPIRRRRCRVGGSDLQLDGREHTQKNSLNFSKEHSNIVSAFSSLSTSGITQEVNDNRNNRTRISNEIESRKFQNNFEDPSNMNFSESEHLDFESSDSSDVELNDFEDGSLITQMKSNNAPIHVDADFVSDDLQTNSFQQNSLSGIDNSMDEGSLTHENTSNEEKILRRASKECTGYVSESSLSVSTISAEEAVDRNLKLSIDTSPQSSCSSEDTSELNSSSSITSDESFNEVAMKDFTQAFP